MAIQIQFRRGTAAEWAGVNPTLAEGEMGIETDTDLFKIGDGILPWNSLDYGGLRGFLGSTGFTGSIGNVAVDNVLYVAKSGNDSNDGTSFGTAKLTIKSALTEAENGTTIFVKSGDYVEDNPLRVPEGVAIVGDSLRTTIIRPQNVTQDLFHVDNAVYIANMTFKDHEAPSAAVAFPPDGSVNVVHTSPYVQNCTSMTTTGTGMRVDGDHVLGLRSMVVDAYTQYNQGGIGIHMLNRGNTQLVSVFTICTDVAFLCENGGFCSITNSNSSFGNIGLKADGVSEPLYTGKVVGPTSGTTFTIDNLIVKPNVNDAVKFAGDDTFYSVLSATPISSGNVEIETANYAVASSDKRNLRNTVLDNKSKIQVDTVDFLNETYPDFDFNQFKTSRDTGLVIEASVDDMVFGTNYKTVAAGRAYYRQSGNFLRNNQLVETVASLRFARDEVASLIDDSSENSDSANILNNIDTVIEALEVGENTLPSIVYPDPTGLDPNVSNAKNILLNNKQFLIEEGIAYIADTYQNFTYDSDKCKRDVEYILEGSYYDIVLNTNYNSVYNGIAYTRGTASEVIQSQKVQTIGGLEYAKGQANNSLSSTTAIYRNTISFDEVIDIIQNGVDSANELQWSDNGDVDRTNSRAQLQINKDFIIAEVISYINTTYPSLNYNQSTCERDLDYIIDAISYDIQYGGNSATLRAARSYYEDAVSVLPADQKTATADAFDQLSNIVDQIIFATYPNQNINLAPGGSNEANEASGLVQIIRQTVLDDSLDNLPTEIYPDISWVDQALVSEAQTLQTNATVISQNTVTYIDNTYVNFTYEEAKCREDIGYIFDAVLYDLVYDGNSQTADAADEYYSGGYLQVPIDQRQITADTFDYIKNIAQSCVKNLAVTPLNSTVTQDTSVTAATDNEAVRVGALFDIVVNLIANAYSSTITLQESVPSEILDNADVSFHQFSLITSSGHTFEWVGAGTNINAALPYLGGTPLVDNQVVEENQGKVYFTGTDQFGDFRIGNDFVINRNTGTVTGRTFTRSLFAILTPYILAIGE